MKPRRPIAARRLLRLLAIAAVLPLLMGVALHGLAMVHAMPAGDAVGLEQAVPHHHADTAAVDDNASVPGDCDACCCVAGYCLYAVVAAGGALCPPALGPQFDRPVLTFIRQLPAGRLERPPRLA